MSGTGQVILAIGALILFGISLLVRNEIILNKQGRMMETEAMLEATSIGQELIEQIINKRFDQNVVTPIFREDTTHVTDSTHFTAPSSLGIDAGEILDSAQTYNDIDDYKGYQYTIATPRLGNFIVSSNVYYVLENSPDVISPAVQTSLKRIDVKVKNPHIATSDSTISLSKIVSYRFRGY